MRVFDDKGEIRTGTSVQVSSTNPDFSFNETLSAEAGTFRQSLPPNRIFKVTASEGGMTTRSQNISLSPGENKLLEFRDKNAISDKPEIIAIEPGYSKAWDPYASIRITFSESMDQDAVENALAIQSTDSDATFLAGNLPVPYSESFMSSPETVASIVPSGLKATA